MMQWTLALAVLATMVLAESAPATAVGSAEYRLLAAIAGTGLIAIFATASASVTTAGLRRDFAQRRKLLDRFGRLRTAHMMLWLAVVLATEYGLSWSRVVRADWGLNNALLLDELLILTPVLLPVFLSWAAFYEVDRAVRIARRAATDEVIPLWSRTGYLLFQARHQLGVLMVPLLSFLAIHDSVQIVRPDLLDKPLGAVIFGLPVAALFILFPLLLRNVWKTEPLGEGPLRARLSAVARQSGFCPTEILVWQTEGMVANAAVTGIWHRLRYVFLSDRLLAHFSDDELVAVFGHELGHVRYRHLLTRGLAIMAPLAAWWSIEFWLPGVAASVAAIPDAFGMDDLLARSLVALAALGAALIFVLGFYSQRLEHEADLFAIKACGEFGSSEETESLAAHPFVTALEKLAVLNGMSRASNSWQHASIARRIEFLARAVADPAFARRFHGRVKLVGRLLLTIVLFGLMSQALAFLASAGMN